MEKISWGNRVTNEVLRAIKKERNILHIQDNERRLNGLVTSCLGTAFSNTLLRENSRGIIVMMRRRGRIGKQLLEDTKEKKICWNLKEEVLDRTLWRARS
jgi:hypothetical protein